MKLLLDANLSWRLIKKLNPHFNDIVHAKDIQGIQPIKDIEIWKFAKKNGFTIVSKDDDFEKLAILKKSPPKVIFLKTFNSNTDKIAEILINNKLKISEFCSSNTDEILEIYYI